MNTKVVDIANHVVEKNGLLRVNSGYESRATEMHRDKEDNGHKEKDKDETNQQTSSSPEKLNFLRLL
ncbi:hypothetical protein CJU90_4226 [Yarrowia sp. C11]|nr:hypothetical protein CJU90_4226 [Yarrowia sp. C11]